MVTLCSILPLSRLLLPLRSIVPFASIHKNPLAPKPDVQSNKSFGWAAGRLRRLSGDSIQREWEDAMAVHK